MGKILIDVITGTYYLTVMIGKVIPDLHPGNILVLQNNTHDIPKALIHDFGRCYSVSDDAPATYKATLMSFCTEFLSCSTRDDLIIPREILAKVNDMYNIINKKHVDLNIKEIYEKYIFPIIY